jgi:hypothetical protein
MAFKGKHTSVYSTSEDGGLIHYVRLIPIETNQYPHGLALATKCKTKEEAEGFAKLVDEYIDEWLSSDSAV